MSNSAEIERLFQRLADIESETYLEYYMDESQTKADLERSLESKKGDVIKMIEELREMGISYDKILSKIEFLGKNHSTNIWYFGQPASGDLTGHGSGYYDGDDERKIRKHENCSWTLDIIKDIIKDMKKLPAEKMLKTEYSYKKREEEKDDLPELDDGIKQMIYQYLKDMDEKTKKKSKKKTKKKSKKKTKKKTKKKSKK